MILLQNVLHHEAPVHILIDGGRIAKISAQPLDVPGAEIMDCSGKAVIPGFVNAHTHAATIMLRGIHEDLNLYDWLQNIWKIEARMDGEFLYWGTRLACLEMIKSGTTVYNDQYWFAPHTRQAAVDMGIHPVYSFTFLDGMKHEMALRQRDACERLYQRTLEWGEDSQFAISIRSVYTVSEENILWATELARKRGLRIHLHLAETRQEYEDCKKNHGGLSPTAYFNSLGVFGPDVIAAHCLFLNPEDIEILGEHKVNCVHCINSNLKLSSGYRFRYEELRDAGANVCIGTDGASSSNNLDILEHMKNSALLQKAWRENPCSMPLEELLDCATAHGARALGIDTGVIREGAWADLSLIDLNNCYFLSPGSVLANLVYAAHSDVITDVLARGKWVMRDRVVPSEQEVLEGARRVLSKIH